MRTEVSKQEMRHGIQSIGSRQIQFDPNVDEIQSHGGTQRVHGVLLKYFSLA